MTYPAFDETGYVRVTFEGLDSFRMSRGEFPPFETVGTVCVLEPSDWLTERHAYEARHYGSAYEWGRGADTMLTDTHHYLFCFHDDFVEVLARGLWFERRPDAWPPDAPLGPSHPARPLAPDTRIEAGEHDGVAFELRANPRPAEHVIADARLYSQPLFELLLDGRVTQSVRLRDDRAWLEGSLGVEEAWFDDLPGLEDVRPHFRAFLTEVARRRAEMRGA